MLRVLSSFPLFITVLVALSITFPVFSRPFDQQYNRIGVPFAVFYNPSLIGNNPGYTIGFDMMSDDVGYDLRGALTMPIGKVMRREDLVNNNSGGRLGYVGPSYRSSGSAASIGGVYAGPKYHQVSAGFVAPIFFMQSGASFDLINRDDQLAGALNLAFAANMPNSMKNNMFYLGLNNLVVSDRDYTDDLSVSIGAAGILAASGPLSYAPYELSFTCHVRDDLIRLMEGTVAVNLDLAPLRVSGGPYGQLPAAALGYTLTRQQGGAAYNHKIFANFGITFINKFSSAAILGSYGRNDGITEKGAAFFYSECSRGGITEIDRGLAADLMYRDIDGGQYLFALNAAETTIRSWVLRIENPRGGSIRTFSGGGAVPSSVLWDGLNGDGSKVEEDVVFAKLVIMGESKVVESNIIQIPLTESGDGGRDIKSDAARMLRKLPPAESPLKMPPK